MTGHESPSWIARRARIGDKEGLSGHGVTEIKAKDVANTYWCVY